jgi:autotransporter passenger strand-loop-strand repeat protein
MGVTVTSGQTSNVSFGETDNGDIVLYGGTLNVLSGGIIINTADSGGQDYVSSGGTAFRTLLTSNINQLVITAGQEYVDGTASGTIAGAGSIQYVFPGGLAVGTLLSGAVQYVYSGSTASNTIVGSGGGAQIIESGGTFISTTVLVDGRESVGGYDIGAVVTSGGVQVVEFTGIATGTIVSGGTQIVIDFGTAVDTTVDSGGTQLVGGVSGFASGTIVNSGGTLGLFDTAIARQLHHKRWRDHSPFGRIYPQWLCCKRRCHAAGSK